MRYPFGAGSTYHTDQSSAATLQRRRTLPIWMVRPRIHGWVLLSMAGVCSFQSPSTRKGARPAVKVGCDLRRVSLRKGPEVLPVGSCLAPRGATTRPALAEAEDTLRYLSRMGFGCWYACGLTDMACLACDIWWV